MTIKGIGGEYRRKLAEVINKAKGILTPDLVSDVLSVSSQEAGRLLSRWNKQGWVKRIKQGVYIPIPVDDLTGNATIEDPWVLADRLFSPGYIGGFSAIKYWDFSEQLFETTTFFTAKKIKEHNPTIGSSRLQLKNIVAYKIFGTQPIWRDSSRVMLSDPTKTIVDILDDPKIVGGMRVAEDIFLGYKKSEHYDPNKLIDYALKMNNKTIIKRFGFLMESMGLSDSLHMLNLDKHISSGYSVFDPTIENTCISRKWNLKIPKAWKNK